MWESQTNPYQTPPETLLPRRDRRNDAYSVLRGILVSTLLLLSAIGLAMGLVGAVAAVGATLQSGKVNWNAMLIAVTGLLLGGMVLSAAIALINQAYERSARQFSIALLLFAGPIGVVSYIMS